MRIDFPEDAAGFKGSKSWLQRFKRRFGIVTRKKTNVKNTTWEETEPVLQNYFRAYRRRLCDAEWRSARAATVAAARAAQIPAPDVDGGAAADVDAADADADADAAAADPRRRPCRPCHPCLPCRVVR